jgi:monoterpene epsilon-lactone hydrolase
MSVAVTSPFIPPPRSISATAQQILSAQSAHDAVIYPEPDDLAGWRAFVATANAQLRPMLQGALSHLPIQMETLERNGVRIYSATPHALAEDDRAVILDMHGGAFIMCGGDLCAGLAAATAMRLQRRVWSIDYRMPPDHPYPAALDDCVSAYRALLAERQAHEIVVAGASAGGGLAGALLLRARDEGLALPAGAVLMTPEVDLTESGDSFATNRGIDSTLGSLMPINLLYAAGHDLAHPYISPLFGDFRKGFPPTLLSTGTRDLFLSNTVRMHRALRAADIAAELHVLEAAPHTGFPGAPEGQELDREIIRFVRRALGRP